MRCQLSDADIGDYVDGTLDEATSLAVAAHLPTCTRCRSLVADFAVIRSAARTLDVQVPAPDVWRRIATQLDRQGHTRRGWWSAWQPVAAAAMALILVASLSWIGGRLVALNAESGRLAATTRPPGSEFDLVEAQYTRAISGLESIAETDDGTLDAETAGILRANLTVIDGAIVESRTALQTEPDSDVAQQSLFEALRSKVELLEDMIALINEMRKGDPEGAARVVSGLNP